MPDWSVANAVGKDNSFAMIPPNLPEMTES